MVFSGPIVPPPFDSGGFLQAHGLKDISIIRELNWFTYRQRLHDDDASLGVCEGRVCQDFWPPRRPCGLRRPCDVEQEEGRNKQCRG